jgi:acetylglutamate kinase
VVDPKIHPGPDLSPRRLCPGDRPDRRLREGETYNINADTVAGALAGALKAKRMLLLTDVAGVLDADGELIRQMTVEEAREAIASGVARAA